MSTVNSLQACMQWWRTWKTLPVFYWIRAAQNYRKGAYAKAEHDYRMGLLKHVYHPARSSAHLDFAYCLFKQRKLRECEVELKDIIARYPDLKEAYLRLARLHMWLGRTGESSLVLRRAIQRFPSDSDISALLLLSLIEQDASRYLVNDAIMHAKSSMEKNSDHKLLRIAMARSAYHFGEKEKGRALLSTLACEDPAQFEAVLAFAEVLLLEEKTEEGLRHLRRALQVSPSHPRILTLISKAYLTNSLSYNPEFSHQLAVMACQSSGWVSSRDLHQLAKAYVAKGDKLSALVTASRAKEVGGSSHVNQLKFDMLDSLIETLTNDLQAQ